MKNIIFGLLCTTLLGGSIFSAEEPNYSKTLLRIDAGELNEDVRKYEKSIRKLLEDDANSIPGKLKSLVFALACGDFKTADELKNDVDLNAKTPSGKNIIVIYAIVPGSRSFLDQVRWMLENKIDIDLSVNTATESLLQPDGTWKTEENNATFIEMVADNPDVLPIIYFYRPDIIDKPNPRSKQTPLGYVSGKSGFSSGEKEIVSSLELFISFNTDIDKPGLFGQPPIVHAITHGRYDNALMLLSYGANANVSFEFRGRKYDDILDFLENSPFSKEEDQGIKNIMSSKQELPGIMLVNIKAKKALPTLLRKIMNSKQAVQ